MANHTTWSNWFVSHASNDAGNCSLKASSKILNLNNNNATKLRQLVEEIDMVIFAADANKRIMILHSPKNFGRTQTRPKNKVVCMLGMGTQSVSVLVDLNLVPANCNIIVPTVDVLSRCKTVQEVKDIPIPGTNGLIGFEGSAIFIPGPFLQDAIITLNSNDPFNLIPLMNSRARDFETKVADILAEMNGNPVNHADDLNAWLYGVKQGTIPETRYSVLLNDNEIAQFNFQQCQACISRGGFQQIAGVTWATNNQAANVDDHASVLQQLTAAISAQNKAAIESNNLCQNKILRQVSREESKKDCAQKIHPSIIKIVCRAAALCSTDETEALPATCSHFINQENAGMAQYNLVHQFKEQGFHDVTFAVGTTNALYVGGFLYADSSTPSNFTIFAFHEQEPNLDNH
jgi:hypothetical protein